MLKKKRWREEGGGRGGRQNVGMAILADGTNAAAVSTILLFFIFQQIKSGKKCRRMVKKIKRF